MQTTLSVEAIQETAAEWHVKMQNPNFSVQDEQLFFEWLEQDPTHQAAFLKVDALWGKCSAVDESRFDCIGRKRKLHTKRNIFYACAASIAILFVGFGFLNYGISEPEPAYYSTIVGLQKTIQLKDSTQITLNTNSSVKVILDDTSRHIYLTRGEVFFDVSNSSIPFDVITDKGVVRVLGTKFSVSTFDKTTEVTVLEGKVALNYGATEKDAFIENVVLRKNEKMNFEQVQEKLAPISINPEKAFAWRNKRLIYDGEPLVEVISDLNRYYKTQLVIKDSDIAREPVIAVLQLDQKLDSTLFVLKQSLPINVVQTAEKEIRLSRK